MDSRRVPEQNKAPGFQKKPGEPWSTFAWDDRIASLIGLFLIVMLIGIVFF